MMPTDHDKQLAAMREVERVTRERAAQRCRSNKLSEEEREYEACNLECHSSDADEIIELAPLTDAELTEIWERSHE